MVIARAIVAVFILAVDHANGGRGGGVGERRVRTLETLPSKDKDTAIQEERQRDGRRLLTRRSSDRRRRAGTCHLSGTCKCESTADWPEVVSSGE